MKDSKTGEDKDMQLARVGLASDFSPLAQSSESPGSAARMRRTWRMCGCPRQVLWSCGVGTSDYKSEYSTLFDCYLTELDAMRVGEVPGTFVAGDVELDE